MLSGPAFKPLEPPVSIVVEGKTEGQWQEESLQANEAARDSKAWYTYFAGLERNRSKSVGLIETKQTTKTRSSSDPKVVKHVDLPVECQR
jgi:hypothetical protein